MSSNSSIDYTILKAKLEMCKDLMNEHVYNSSVIDGYADVIIKVDTILNDMTGLIEWCVEREQTIIDEQAAPVSSIQWAATRSDKQARKRANVEANRKMIEEHGLTIRVGADRNFTYFDFNGENITFILSQNKWYHNSKEYFGTIDNLVSWAEKHFNWTKES